MKENKEETKLQSEQKTAEGILNQFEPNSEYPQYYHEGDVLKAMEEYASQFKSQLPKLPYHFDRNGKPKYESQPLPIEGVEREEYILCSAIWYNDGKKHIHQPVNVMHGFVVCGRRHHNIINTLASAVGWNSQHCEQGFITSNDRFVNRQEALLIALRAKQIKAAKYGDELYSEDLY